MPKIFKRVARGTGKAIGVFGDMMARPTVAPLMEDARKSRMKVAEVQRKRASRALQAEYAKKEAAMPPNRNDQMNESIDFNRKNNLSSSGRGVGY